MQRYKKGSKFMPSKSFLGGKSDKIFDPHCKWLSLSQSYSLNRFKCLSWFLNSWILKGNCLSLLIINVLINVI